MSNAAASTSETKEGTTAPSLATPAPQLSSVADLERRLQILDTTNTATTTTTAAAPVAPPAPAMNFAKPAPPAAAAKPASSGKSALLVREKQQRVLSLEDYYEYLALVQVQYSTVQNKYGLF